jgi:hypothetical protein
MKEQIMREVRKLVREAVKEELHQIAEDTRALMLSAAKPPNSQA